MSIESQYKSEIKLFCKHIRELRKEMGLTQKQLMQLSGITQSQVSLLENPDANPNPELYTLVKLAWGFKIELAVLFGYLTKLKSPSSKSRFKSVEKRFQADKKNFGERVEIICRHRKLKQDELSILARIYPADLSRYINGESNIEFYNILKLAHALEVKIFDLFNFNGPLPDNKSFKGKLEG